MSEIITDSHEAALRLQAGALVAVPTETVYGLAADAANEEAVRRVFAVKGRPRDHPLIVHLDDPAHAAAWSTGIDPRLEALTRAYWPGPLTVIVPKAAWVPEVITGGQPTVALRVPEHPLTRRVLADLTQLKGRPAAVVAPSANRFGQVSPTTAAHVLDGLGPQLAQGDAVLDGGACRIGVESTVVAVVGGELRVLRPGGVSVEQAASGQAGAPAPRAPGTLAAHYAPHAQVVVAESEDLPNVISRVGDTWAGFIAPAEVATPAGWLRLAAPTDGAEYARDLYASLRAADERGVRIVVAVPPPPGGLGDAVRDRLARAAAGSQHP